MDGREAISSITGTIECVLYRQNFQMSDAVATEDPAGTGCISRNIIRAG